MSHRVNGEIALPGSDVEYQKLTYDAQAYFPLGKDFVLRGYGKLGYGNDLPFYKNFYAGGFGSVRGYDNSTLGPKYPGVTYSESDDVDYDPEEVGGNALIQFGTELALPLPLKGIGHVKSVQCCLLKVHKFLILNVMYRVQPFM